MIQIMYYAHAMQMYGTEREQEELRLIQATFPECVIYNPNRPYIQNHADPMRACLDVIADCHALIFAPYLCGVTMGVNLEIHHARKHNVPVYILDNPVELFFGNLSIVRG